MEQYDSLINRAQLLLTQNRYDLADETLRKAIGLEPNRGDAYIMLSLVKCSQESYREANELAERSIALAPDNPNSYYALASVLYHRDKFAEAAKAIDSAIRLDPTDPNYHGLSAHIALQQYRWQDAVDAAEMGLQFDPDHQNCNNTRAIALTKLGRRDEAGIAIDSVLAKNPENSTTHANSGWTKLHAGKADEAAEHFKEALRLDPNNEWARSGIVESLKAKNFIYRQFLRYILWVSRFPPKVQMIAFIGIIVVLQIMVRMPEGGLLQTIGLWLALAYMCFVGSLWLASPLFDLLLRFSRYGRMVLTDAQKADTNYLVIAATAVAILISGPLLTRLRLNDLIYYAVLLLPVAVCLNTSRDAKRKQAAAAVVAIFVIAGIYWYRFYINTGIDGLTTIRDVVDYVVQISLAEPDDAGEKAKVEQRVLEITAYFQAQNRLHDFFFWPAVAMTWISDYFHRRNR
ncbi:tetratricopeptide repeat protein [Stieleria sp. JC731]|uniref:tetratricopeptide repeat protein n=1 Tax=Pirellulaceae TaxID=2691357 RepID=UPI001E5C106F|nr:tetratricopeptide repeat protein [Stieleria sp. JC731]MCC9599212.1 tetratricopeptide repeat protein [Stieleria sp. JC731]